MILLILDIIKKLFTIMHKSIIVLLGLLVFLIPVGPSIGNLNALAFNDYEYDVDYYEQDYGIEDNNYGEKSYEKEDGTLTTTNNKCSNINIYISGLEINELPDYVNGLASQVQAAGEARDSSSFGNGRSNGPSGSDKGFESMIDTNNNNVVSYGDEPPSTPPEMATTLSVSLTIKCTPDDSNPRSAQACNRITTEILPNIYNIDITGNHPNPNRFNGLPVPVIVTLGPDVFLVFVTVSTQVIDTIIDNIQSDLNVNIFGPTEHFIGHCPSGEIFAGESLTCNIEERLTVASN